MWELLALLGTGLAVLSPQAVDSLSASSKDWVPGRLRATRSPYSS